jgi:hypothetical protein
MLASLLVFALSYQRYGKVYLFGGIFDRMERKKMQKSSRFLEKNAKKTQIKLIFALVLSSCLLLFGCRKGESEKQPLPVVETNMMADAQFLASVTSNRMSQMRIAAKRADTVDKMQKIIASVKSGLPANATEEQVRAELAKNAEWKVLERENAERNAELLNQLKEARRLVGARMQKQRQDIKSVREGKAVAKPVAKKSSIK